MELPIPLTDFQKFILKVMEDDILYGSGLNEPTGGLLNTNSLMMPTTKEKLEVNTQLYNGNPSCNIHDATSLTTSTKDGSMGTNVPDFAKQSPYTEPFEAKQAEASVTIKYKDGVTTTSEQIVGKPTMFAAPPCEVEVALGFTHNLGDFNSARAEVRIRVPCAHGETAMVYDWAKAWVDSRLDDIAKQMAPEKK